MWERLQGQKVNGLNNGKKTCWYSENCSSINDCNFNYLQNDWIFCRYVCTGGATSYIPTIPTHGYMCPTGHFCIEGTTQEEGCPLGTYQSNMGQDHCLSCPAGKMCTEMNLTLPLDCKTGMWVVISEYGGSWLYESHTYISITRTGHTVLEVWDILCVIHFWQVPDC